MDLPSFGLSFDHSLQEGDEFLACVPLGGHSFDLSGAYIERSIEREYAMSFVLESMSLSSAGGQRKNRIPTVQRLNRSLLINADDDRILGR
jgi:hypothetical protein